VKDKIMELKYIQVKIIYFTAKIKVIQKNYIKLKNLPQKYKEVVDKLIAFHKKNFKD